MPDPEPHPSVAPASLELSRRLGTVRLEKQLARWLWGSLHLGRDSATDTNVFVWICTPAPERLQIEERFLSNGRLLAPLEHPALLAVRAMGREGDEFFVVTESSDGVPFPAVTNESDRTIAGWGRDLALALQAMHRSGLVVCDIHPANMRVEATGSIRWWGAGLTQYLVDPTTEYSSPEQARGEKDDVGPPSDIYSLGAVLHRLLSGAPPFVGPTDRVLTQIGDRSREVPPIRDLVPKICPALEAIVGKALRKDPVQRYGDAAALAVDLQRLLVGDPVPLPIRFAGAPPFHCPACHRRVATPKPRCIYCDADVTGLPAAPGGRAVLRSPSPGDEPRRVPLPAVRLGLACHSVRLILYMLAAIVAMGGVGASLIFDPHGKAAPEPILALTLLTLALLLAVPPFLGIIGSALCLATPREANARLCIGAALIFDTATLALGAVPFLLGADDPLLNPFGIGLLRCAQMISGMLAWVFVLAYCGRLAGYLGRVECQVDAQSAIKRGLLLTLGGVCASALVVFGVLGAKMETAFVQVGAEIGIGLGVIVAMGCLFFLSRLLFEMIALFRVLREATAPP